jgi:NADH:quinone reductase (non-electrogenic)
MKLMVRRVLIGLACGTVSSPFLCLAVRDIGLGVSFGALLGLVQIFAFFDLRDYSAIDRAMTSGALGLPFWATINVIFLPLVRGEQPQWTAEEMRALFPALICWVLSCFLLGILSQAARELAQSFAGTNLTRVE